MTFEVNGAVIASFAHVCTNHRFLLDKKTLELAESVNTKDLSNTWLPFQLYLDLSSSTDKVYEDSKSVHEKIGEEICSLWFENVFNDLNSTLDFLNHQVNSKGYHSIVRGKTDDTGFFNLEYLNEKEGIALIHSSTPFNRHLEVGILRKGMSYFNATYANVTLSDSQDYFFLEFH